MIDLHHHCLPGVDDGPHDMEGSIALCRMAAEEGVATIVATPHVLRGHWENTSRDTLQALLDELQQRIGPSPRLLLGSEYFFAHDVNEVLANGSVVPLAGSRYVLIEFASNNIPPLVEQPLYRMQLDGWVPLIAHPERNTFFQAKPELLASLIRLGVRTQVTSGSFVGHFGDKARATAFELLKRGMVHVIATDAHNTNKRPPVVRAARELVVETANAAVAEALFVTNPQAVLDGVAMPYEPDVDLSSSKPPLLSRMKRLFGGS